HRRTPRECTTNHWLVPPNRNASHSMYLYTPLHLGKPNYHGKHASTYRLNSECNMFDDRAHDLAETSRLYPQFDKTRQDKQYLRPSQDSRSELTPLLHHVDNCTRRSHHPKFPPCF